MKPNIRDKTFNKLLEYYQSINDIKKFVSVCDSIVKLPTSTAEIRGEVAEVVLYVMLEDFIKKNNIKDWRIAKSLVVKDLNNPKSNYLTELDLTVFTPKCIFSFECKSYKGKKFLTKQGFLYRYNSAGKTSKAMDVYDQHYKHFKTLFTNIISAKRKDLSHPKYKSFKLLYFDFADIPTEDKRDEYDKSVFPLIRYQNLYSIFDDYWKRPDYWNMHAIDLMVDAIEKVGSQAHKKHLEYVKDLNKRR